MLVVDSAALKRKWFVHEWGRAIPCRDASRCVAKKLSAQQRRL